MTRRNSPRKQYSIQPDKIKMKTKNKEEMRKKTKTRDGERLNRSFERDAPRDHGKFADHAARKKKKKAFTMVREMRQSSYKQIWRRRKNEIAAPSRGKRKFFPATVFIVRWPIELRRSRARSVIKCLSAERNTTNKSERGTRSSALRRNKTEKAHRLSRPCGRRNTSEYTGAVSFRFTSVRASRIQSSPPPRCPFLVIREVTV